MAQRKTEKTGNGPICIEQMSFLKPLGPNGTVITVFSRKAGREQKPPHSDLFMQLVDNFSKMIDFRSRFGAHWILKGVPTSTVFGTNIKNEKNEVQETG